MMLMIMLMLITKVMLPRVKRLVCQIAQNHQALRTIRHCTTVHRLLLRAPIKKTITQKDVVR